MDAKERPAPDPVTAALLREPLSKSFFVVVDLVQRLHPEADRVGEGGSPDREALRFGVDPSLTFAPGDVAGIQVGEPDGRVLVSVRFLGLTGAESPLPTVYAEEALQRGEESPARGMLDLFHHRMLSFFFRTWERSRHAVRYRAGGDDWTRRLLGLAGIGGEWSFLAPSRLLACLGLLLQAPRSAAVLRGILAEIFDPLPVRVLPCTGGLHPLETEKRLQLGRRRASLGRDAILGLHVIDPEGRFTVEMGPMNADDFDSFLPGERRRGALEELLDRLRPDGLEYAIVLRLSPGTAAPCRLGDRSARLGWCAWLGTPTGTAQVPFYESRRW